MINRRKFIWSSLAASLGIGFPLPVRPSTIPGAGPADGGGPVIISTWSHGIPANEAAIASLSATGRVLDAVEAGVRVTEADPQVTSVGYGGFPDAAGEVSLDACIMDTAGNAGSVACLKEIMHPVSVARRVMEKTPHVMLAGEGALQFALGEGFPRKNLLTERAKKEWKQWKQWKKQQDPDARNHDTIGMLVMDTSGNMAGACSTSGLANKMPGRVGDSPIIGAGLFIDNEVGGASATGHGELVMKVLGSFLVVEGMRNGLDPEEACREALERIQRKVPVKYSHQVGFIALNKAGKAAGYSLRDGFEYAIHQNGENRLVKSPCLG